MSLLDKIDKDTIEALKAGDKERVTVLRGLKSELKYRKIELKKELTNDDILQVLTKSAKKIRDSIEQFGKAGRDDLVTKEQFDLKIVTAYLPEPMSEEKLKALIAEAITESGADSPQKVGLVMKAVMPKVKGQADGKLISKLAAEMLAKQV